MRAVVQRVTKASVSVAGEAVGSIGRGFVVLLGVTHDDGEEQARFLANKIANLRIFADNQGKLNLSALEVGADVLVVSQFTLYGNVRKGRRPSFTGAARPEVAEPLVERFSDFYVELVVLGTINNSMFSEQVQGFNVTSAGTPWQTT